MQPNPDASRTVTWVMNDSAGLLAAQNVSFASGNASLTWTPVSLSWSKGSDFAANVSGSLDPNVTADARGLALGANLSNRLLDGNFASAGTWTYSNGTANNTTAQWVSDLRMARLNHSSPTTQTLWDSFATIAAEWTPTSSLQSTSHVYQASGAMGDFVNVTAGLDQYAGALNGGIVNWSGYDQLRIMIHLNASAPAAFNISALDSGFHGQTTKPVALAADWNAMTVDLDQLGPNRSALTALRFRIVGLGGQRLPPLNVLFLDAEVGRAKVADTTASVSQAFTKSATTPSAGSAYLSFNWTIANQTGVVGSVMSATLSGPSGLFIASLSWSFPSQWHHFVADVSPHVADPGSYSLTFRLRVELDNITASNVTAYVDNAAFVYPNRHNGTYLSQPLSFGADSRYLSVTWSATVPSGETTARLAFQTGNTTSAWGSWHTFADPGTYGLTEGAVLFRVRADLTTTNASLSPLLSALSVSAEHRIAHGVIISETYSADSDFLRWRRFNASWEAGSLNSVTFWVGNGSYWTAVTPGANLGFVTGSRLAWKAVLTTFDTLQTPALTNVEVTYEFLGTPVSISITPGGPLNVTQGQSVMFSARVLDAGSHVVPTASIVWSTTDPQGHVYNNGTYVAGSIGDFYVNATVSGLTSVARSVVVHVSAGNLPVGGLDWGVWPYVLLVAAAAAIGFAIYQFSIVRVYAIDDVFLIAKDGRLIVHNTRRMRADRDEDILSGMLTAIMSFLRDQDPEENGELKRFEVGGKTTLLERGQHVYLAAIYSGRVPGWAGKDLRRFVVDLEEHFGEAFENWSGSPEDLHGVKEFMTRFVSHVRYRGAARSGNLAS